MIELILDNRLFDIVTPFLRGVLFGVSAVSVKGGDIRRLLKRFGVFCWGIKFHKETNEYTFFVRREKASWALRVLEWHSFPVTIKPPVATKLKKRRRKKWRK
jgi:hypothetical protein